MGGLICNINKMSLILVAKNESGNKQKANPLHPCNLSKGKAILCASPYANSKLENGPRVSHVPLGKGKARSPQSAAHQPHISEQ